MSIAKWVIVGVATINLLMSFASSFGGNVEKTAYYGFAAIVLSLWFIAMILHDIHTTLVNIRKEHDA